MNNIRLRRAVFLDRDGVVNLGAKVDRWEELVLVPGAPGAIASLQMAGLVTVLTTNQTALGEDHDGNVIWDEARLNRQHLSEIHDRMHYLLGVRFDLIKFCPHAYWLPGGAGCKCHKPNPGMILEAAQELNIDLARSWMIGDRASDMHAAAAAGIGRRFLVTSGVHENEADKVRGGLAIVPSIVEAAALILGELRAEHPMAC